MAEFNFLNSPEFGALGQVNQQVVNNQRIAETTRLFGEIAMQPVEAQLKLEQARYAGSRAGLAEQQLKNQQAWAAMIKQRMSAAGQPGTSTPQMSPSAQLNAAANDALEYGSMTMDPKALVAAGSLARAASQITENEARTTGIQAKNQTDRLDRALGVLDSDLPDDQKMEYLMQAVPADKPGEADMVRRMLTTPEGRTALRRTVMTERQRISADAQQQNADRLEENSKLTRRLRDAQITHLNALTTKLRNSEAAGAKAGKPLVTVSGKEEEAAARELLSRYPGLADKDAASGLDTLARNVALDAKNNMRQGMRPEAAMDKAIKGYADHLVSFTQRTGGVNLPLIGNVGGTNTHTTRVAQPLPAKPADAVEGQIYLSPRGPVRRVKGGWEAVQQEGGPTKEEQDLLDEEDDSGDE